ncbi:MAG: hypothetical protein HQ546_06535, partial [Planctomycetes bacterium]|nr:hypothetical protein [Planctomycetota bacterium]
MTALVQLNPPCRSASVSYNAALLVGPATALGKSGWLAAVFWDCSAMDKLTSKERITRILERKSVDRIGLSESFWPETQKKWAAAGHVRQDENLADHFGFDICECGWFNMVADLDFTEQIVEETDETKLVRDGNGALLRWWKNKSGTPEHVDFLVKDRLGWEEHVKGRLLDTGLYRRRINFEAYRQARGK